SCPGIITTVIQTAISATIHLYGYGLVVTSPVVIYPLAEVKGNGHVKARFPSHIHIGGAGGVISCVLRRCARLAVSRSWIRYRSSVGHKKGIYELLRWSEGRPSTNISRRAHFVGSEIIRYTSHDYFAVPIRQMHVLQGFVRHNGTACI